MYQDHFELEENPFALTPDPRFLYLSRHHREALAHLLYGMGEMGGFVQVTGEVGTGKTTLCRSLLEQVPEWVNVALILNPKQNGVELVASICDELGVSYPEGTASTKILIDCLNRHLLAAHASGWRTVLVIDEAQNLSVEVLEQVRLLTNLETTTHKLLQILLLGQPELKTLMAQPQLRQLSQRITARYHLTPLRGEETAAYIQHRLDVAGCHRPLFSASAIRLIHRLAGGVPRLINIICDRSLLGAYARRQSQVDKSLIRKAASEVTGEPLKPRIHIPVWMAAAGLVCLAAVAGWSLLPAPFWQDLKSVVVRQDPLTSPPVPPAAPETTPVLPEKETIVAIRPPENIKEERAAAPMETVAVMAATTIALVAIADDPPALEPVAPLEASAPETVVVIEPQPPEAPPAEAAPIVPEAAEVTEIAEVEVGRAPVFSDLLKNGLVATDTETAFATLFRYWDVAPTQLKGDTACEQAKSVGLKCFHDRGNWNTLLNYNRPAVLELVDGERRLHDVVLVGMLGGDVVLDFSGTEAVFPRSEIEPFWFGEFILFWKAPPIDVPVLGKGSIGPGVKRLRYWLDRAEGTEMRSEKELSRVFDDALEERVIRFQKYHRLTADGLVGEQTWLLLNTAAGEPSAPALRLPAG